VNLAASTLNFIGLRTTTAGAVTDVNALPDQIPVSSSGGTENSLSLAGVKHGDVVAITLSGDLTLNGIDTTDIPVGFRFTLLPGTAGANTITINDSSGAAAVGKKIETPNHQTITLREDETLEFHRAVGVWQALGRDLTGLINQVAISHAGGTEEALSLTGVKNGDTLAITVATADMVLDGIDATGIPVGFSFVLQNAIGGKKITVRHSQASVSTNNIETPNHVSFEMLEDTCVEVRRAVGVWYLVAVAQVAGTTGATGPTGPTGPTGATGPTGPNATAALLATNLQMVVVDHFDSVGGTATIAAGSANDVLTGSGNWTSESTSGSGGVTSVAGELNHPGILRLSSSSTSGALSALHRGLKNTTHPAPIFANQVFRVQFIVRLPSVAQCRLIVGLAAPSWFSTTDSMLMTFDTNVGTDWVCSTSASGSATSTPNTASTVSTNWVRLTIQQTTVGTVEFYVDSTLIATRTTNVPAAVALQPTIIVGTRTSSPKSVDIDFFALESQNLSGGSIGPAQPVDIEFSVREDADVYNVGTASWMYPTIQAAIAAINSRSPAPSAEDRVVVMVWPGRYDSTAFGTISVPAFTTICGAIQAHDAVQLINTSAPIFSCNGSFTGFYNLTFYASAATDTYAILGNNQSQIRIGHCWFFSENVSTRLGRFFKQSGSTWINLAIHDTVIDAKTQGSGALSTAEGVVFLENTGSLRLNDVWLQRNFWDCHTLSAGGRVVAAVKCQDVRIMDCEIRALGSNGTSIAMKTAGSKMRITKTYAEAATAGLETDAGTDVKIYNSDLAGDDIIAGGACVINGTSTVRNSNIA
jgi:hypothetical protein